MRGYHVGSKILALAMSLGMAASVLAIDQPISGLKLTLKRAASGKEQLSFTSKDPAFLFPAIGGPDDPTTSGLLIELFSPASPTATFGIGVQSFPLGWTVEAAPRSSFKYANKLAPNGATPVFSVLIRKGKMLKFLARETGFPLTGPTGPIGVRITSGSLRSCALFDAATIRKDYANTFSAAGAASSGLSDCSDANLGAYDPAGSTCTQGSFSGNQCGGTCLSGSTCSTQDLSTCVCISPAGPCGNTFPVCNGECPAGEECLSTGGFPLSACGCLPIGSTPCGQFQCAGDCPVAEECNYFERSFPGSSGCLCGPPGGCGTGGDDCPSGFHCATGPPGTFCVPG